MIFNDIIITLIFLGEKGFPDEFAFMSNCVGVGTMAVTKDGHAILMERAGWTGEAPGKVDRPGGHAEPDLVLGVLTNVN